jgi:hypothetical protein
VSASTARRKRCRNTSVVGTVTEKRSADRIVPSMRRISSLVYARAETKTRSRTAGAKISSYLAAMSSDAMPTSCRFVRVMMIFSRKRSTVTMAR